MASKDESNDGVWKALLKRVAGIETAHVKVGVIGSEASAAHGGTGLTNVEIATIHEFGAPRAGIPERSFIRSTFQVRRDELGNIQAAAARGLLDGKYTVDRAFGLIGAWAASAVREQITKYGPFLFSPLAARTIAAKGSSAPLVDTGQLVNSIAFVVMRAGAA